MALTNNCFHDYWSFDELLIYILLNLNEQPWEEDASFKFLFKIHEGFSNIKYKMIVLNRNFIAWYNLPSIFFMFLWELYQLTLRSWVVRLQRKGVFTSHNHHMRIVTYFQIMGTTLYSQTHTFGIRDPNYP